jgi:hypothetical protein
MTLVLAAKNTYLYRKDFVHITNISNSNDIQLCYSQVVVVQIDSKHRSSLVARSSCGRCASDSRMWHAHPAWIWRMSRKCYVQNLLTMYVRQPAYIMQMLSAPAARGACNKGSYFWTPLYLYLIIMGGWIRLLYIYATASHKFAYLLRASLPHFWKPLGAFPFTSVSKRLSAFWPGDLGSVKGTRREENRWDSTSIYRTEGTVSREPCSRINRTNKYCFRNRQILVVDTPDGAESLH